MLNLSTPLLKKISSIPERSKRKARKASMSLFNPFKMETTSAPEIQCSLPAKSEENDNEISEQTYPSTSTCNTNNVSSTQPDVRLQSHYPDKKVFRAALELFNKQMEVNSSTSSSILQRWECKGKIRVSLQLCVSCKDIGKKRSKSDTYYLDVLEVKQCRTILCKGCLGHILYKHFGGSLSEIEKKLHDH